MLEGETDFIARWYKWMLAGCVALPLLIMAAPLIYQNGYGPAGFPAVITLAGKTEFHFVYLFCGWYSPNPLEPNL